MTRPVGIVHLVGAGPWEPSLITVRGRELLERADVVVYDYLVNPALLQHAKKAEHVHVGPGVDRAPQAEINALLVARAQAGQVVVRLKGGDPFVFGRGGEEAAALAAAGVPFEVVPGVTAAIAGAAYAGIPVTHRDFGSTLALVAGHERPEGGEAGDPVGRVDWDAVSRMSTIALYMGAKNLGPIAEALVSAGRSPDTPVALVRWATRPDQEVVTTTLAEAGAEAEQAGLTAPLTVIVGEVVGLRSAIAWYERRPLYGLRVVVTRSAGQAGPLVERLCELGASPVVLPTIDFAPPADPAPLVRALGELGTYDWVIFTSANGVDFALDALRASGRDPRAFGRARLACIGPATARRLVERGLNPDLVPEAFIAEGLLQHLLDDAPATRRYLVLRAEVARETLPDRLRSAGAHVDVVVTYRTQAAVVPAEVLDPVRAGAVDVVTFTASSTVRHFAELIGPEALGRLTRQVPAVCIGPVTAETAREMGFTVAATAETYTVPGLLETLVDWRRGRATRSPEPL